MKSIRCLTRFPSLNKSLTRFSSSNDSTNVQLDFEKAKKRLESSSIDVDNETKLKLYGLFKQSTQGVCTTSKPPLTDFVGRAKWTSWSSLGQLTKIDAQKQYVQFIDQLISSSSSSQSKTEEKVVESSSSNVNEEIELIKKSDQHWHIRLNRPDKYNAITRPMYERLIEILDKAAEDKQVVLVSLTGNGKFYSSGTDLADFAKMATSTTTDLKASVELGQKMLERFVGKFINFPKILIAFVNGPAVGISVSTLALFDGVFASSSSTFSLPFTRTAQSAEGCSSFVFPMLMGPLHAKDLLLFGRKLTAEQAEQRGLVTRVIQHEQFQEEMEKISSDILSLPRGSLLTSKTLIQKWNKDFLHQVNQHEVEILKQRWLTDEFVQAMMEFIRGRKKK